MINMLIPLSPLVPPSNHHIEDEPHSGNSQHSWVVCITTSIGSSVTIGNSYCNKHSNGLEQSLDGIECSKEHASETVWRLGTYELQTCGQKSNGYTSFYKCDLDKPPMYTSSSEKVLIVNGIAIKEVGTFALAYCVEFSKKQ